DTPPSLNKETSNDKKAQWSTKGAIHKSFIQEENAASRRRNSLRKYNSEPVPEKEAEEFYVPSKSQADAPISRYTPPENSQSRSENTHSRVTRGLIYKDFIILSCDQRTRMTPEPTSSPNIHDKPAGGRLTSTSYLTSKSPKYTVDHRWSRVSNLEILRPKAGTLTTDLRGPH
ncbi:hypothetical protein AVEN_91944-1, partial [Araneus ventricosus]